MAAWCADHLRDIQAWKQLGMNFSTTSDESCKLYDGLMRQMYSWADCEALGGISKTMVNMIAADTTAIIARTCAYGFETMGTGTTARVNKKLDEKIIQLEKDSEIYGTPWEKKHVKALRLWVDGHYHKAADIWEDILTEAPEDLLALKFAHEAYFFTGDAVNIRDSMKRVVPLWREDAPCYSYLHGMLAFGYEECGEYKQAETEALKALSLNRFDCWATHARTHVLEMNGRYKEGIDFLEKTVDDWRPGWIIATHNYWHKALFHIENGQFEEAIDIFDQEVAARAMKRPVVLDLVDCSSLLLRLEMQDVDVGDRWKNLPDITSHNADHITAFNDAHLGALFTRQDLTDVEMKMHDSLINYSKSNASESSKLFDIVGRNLYEGMVDFCNEKYSEAADKFLPVRDLVYRVGGSHAQRDLFTQAMINSCIKSEDEKHWKMTHELLLERRRLRHGPCPIEEGLKRRFEELHGH